MQSIITNEVEYMILGFVLSLNTTDEDVILSPNSSLMTMMVVYCARVKPTLSPHNYVSVVSVSFEEAIYHVLESNPSSMIVCVVISGFAERDVEVNVTAMEITAQSKHNTVVIIFE